MKKLFQTICIFAVLSLGYTQLASAAEGNQFSVTLSDGQKLAVTLPANEKPALPMELPNATGTGTEKYNAADIVCVELTDPQARIDGFHRWEVKKVATPSVMLGVKNTESRLLGVVKKTAAGTVYKWIITQKRGDNAADTFFGLWYGFCPSKGEIVYPFIQDGKVWLRDINMILGKTAPDAVQAVNAYYVKGKKKTTDVRKEELKRHPASILEHLSDN